MKKVLLAVFVICLLSNCQKSLARITPLFPHVAQLSTTQVRYLKIYGQPEQFFLTFSWTGQPYRRIEAWLYTRRGFALQFDNGYFVKRSMVPVENSLAVTNLEPQDFTPDLTPAMVVHTFGIPEEFQHSIGNHKLTVYRYTTKETGIKACTFVDNHLQAVSAGLVVIEKHRPYVGLGLANLDSKFLKAMGLSADTKGALVIAVIANSTSSAAGMQKGDVIQAINGKYVSSSTEATEIFHKHKVGDAVNLLILRRGILQAISLKIGEHPQ